MQKIAKITRKRTKIMKNGFFYNFLLHILIFFPILFFNLSDLLLTCQNWLFSKNICHVDKKRQKNN
jgi:hypothetical protein